MGDVVMPAQRGEDTGSARNRRALHQRCARPIGRNLSLFGGPTTLQRLRMAPLLDLLM